MSTNEPVIACTLAGADEMDERVRDWQEVLGHAASREAIDGGVRLRFSNNPATAADLARLAALEVGCCGWLDFTLGVSAGSITLDVHAPEAGIDAVMSLFGHA